MEESDPGATGANSSLVGEEVRCSRIAFCSAEGAVAADPVAAMDKPIETVAVAVGEEEKHRPTTVFLVAEEGAALAHSAADQPIEIAVSVVEVLHHSQIVF